MLVLFMGAASEASEARKDGEAYWERKLDQHPGMRDRVAGVTNMSKIRSTGDTSAFFRASSGPGWALAGDAGHFKDPVIGQGQRDALWAGRTLAEAGRGTAVRSRGDRTPHYASGSTSAISNACLPTTSATSRPRSAASRRP